MNTATHNVEVPFPQAFASPPKKRSPFPSAPRYGHASPRQADRHPTARWECALRRGFTLSIRQAAHAQVDTLVLLPTGTIYRGTQRNTIDLSNVQTLPESIARYRMDVHSTQVPNKGGLFIPASRETGLSGPFPVKEFDEHVKHAFLVEFYQISRLEMAIPHEAVGNAKLVYSRHPAWRAGIPMYRGTDPYGHGPGHTIPRWRLCSSGASLRG